MKLKTIAYRIVEADVKKRRLLRKVEDVFSCETLLEDSMTELVWDILGLKKHTTIGVYNEMIGGSELIKEYYGDDHLTEMYYGRGGVIDGGIKINDYIDEIIKIVKEKK